MLLDIGPALRVLPLILGVTALILGIKMTLAGLATRIVGYPTRTAVLVGLALCQVGEFSFILAKAGFEQHILDERQYQMFLAASILTMGRRYTVAGYHILVDKLRRARPDIALTTDLIVGFPGETEADFRQTLALVREVGFESGFSFMEQSLRHRQDVILSSRGKVSSGLNSPRFYDWEKALTEFLTTEKPEALVVMLGGNDAKNGQGTPRWSQDYQAKSKRLLDITAQYGIPVYWVGLPPMPAIRMSRSAASKGRSRTFATASAPSLAPSGA